jgi:hypothetical protein
VQERADHIAEWVRLTEERMIPVQVAPDSPSATNPKAGGRHESGINAAVRELGIDRTEAQRPVKIASIAPEARQAALDAGLDNNQSASAARARCVQGHCRPTPALAGPDIGRKPPGNRRGAGGGTGERDLLAASGKQNDNGHGGHGFDMAHVFQGCAAFGTDKGLNAAAEDNPAHTAVASSRGDRRKFGGQAAIACGCGDVSLAGWNLCP